MFWTWISFIYFNARSLYSFLYSIFFSAASDTQDPVLLVEPPKYEDKYKKEVVHLKRFQGSWSEEEKQVQLQKITHCHVMEYTPYGNVLMTYNRTREAFEYYSDHVIPYRYLEVAGRKFVKFFQCAFLYVDMEEELAKLKEKKEEKEKEEKEKEEKGGKGKDSEKDTKKNIFAKFKKYQTTDKKRTQAVEHMENVKENTNYYSHQGKLANFQWIQKIDKKEVNKKLTLTFADFKKGIKNSF
jgi:hypothetical protein